MERCQLPLEQKALSIGHANNTLIVTVCYNIIIIPVSTTTPSMFVYFTQITVAIIESIDVVNFCEF